VPYLQVAEGFARDNGWPVVLTLEGRTGGDRVRVCNDSAALNSAYAELMEPSESLSGVAIALRRALWTARTGFHLAGDLSRPPKGEPQLAVEPHVPGRQASYTAVAHEGRVLAGIAAISELSHPAPQIASSIVRLVHDPLMAEMARRVIGRMSFTGFCGVDFVREDASGKTWFLNFNARPTQLSHLGHLAGGDLCAALLASVTNTYPVPQRTTKEMTVALFPQDWIRDPAARERGADHVDMPQGDERLLAALKRMLPAEAVVA
jgi:predicted ATP-grasp superfamily ATP-dependent carboligase